MLHLATADGLLDLDETGKIVGRTLEGVDIDTIAAGWAIGGGAVLPIDGGQPVDLDGRRATALAVATDADDQVLVGTHDAHLLRLGDDGTVELDETFDAVPGRERWYTPWGAPPDVRSIAANSGVLVNVHVGGVWRAEPDGRWTEVVEVDDDTHQVDRVGDAVVVAAAVGVGESHDGGDRWTWSTAGLHASYCRAVAVSGDWLLATASTGPGTRDGRLYRRRLGDPAAPFEPTAGLRERFPFNLDTRQLAGTADERAALGTNDGELWWSDDAGAQWHVLTDALPPIRHVVIGP
ncbi:MAG: hypothetical protein ACRD0G_03175 [Acidimicrobiales bacterium]